jgi:hypothetical protein
MNNAESSGIFFNNGHLTDAAVQLYVDGALPRPQHQHVAAHLKTCRACAAETGRYEQLGETIRQLPLAAPSANFDELLAARIAGVVRENRRGRLIALRDNGIAWLVAASVIAVLAAAALIGGGESPKEPGIAGEIAGKFNLLLSEFSSAFSTLSPIKTSGGYALLLAALAALAGLDRALRRRLH